MALESRLHAKEDRRPNIRAGEKVDFPFLFLILLLLTVGLAMLYSASYAQSLYDTSYAICRSRRFAPPSAWLPCMPSAGFRQECGTGWPGRCTG